MDTQAPDWAPGDAVDSDGRRLVSVVMIFLDAVRFIEEAIESVLAQIYTQWELLLVDDGSTDGSSEIALRYAGQYPGKVRYLEHPGHQNRGMSASRNRGINYGRGQYVAFLDADDVWLPQKLERQVATLESHPDAAMVYGATEWWYSWTGSREDSRRDFVHDLGVAPDTLFQPPALVTLLLKDQSASPCTCSALIRHQVAKRVGGFEEAFRGMYEDQAFFSKVCLSAPVYVSSECWCRYRQHSKSACSVAQGKASSSARLFFLNWLEWHVAQQGTRDAEVSRALREELRPYRHPTRHRITVLSRLLKRRLYLASRAVQP